MKKLKYSTGLKWICYLLIPIIVLILIFSVIYAGIFSEEQYEQGKDFFQTKDFAYQYYNVIIQKVRKRDSTYKKVTIAEQEIYYETARENYRGLQQNFEYIIINHDTNKIYTNIPINNLEQMKQEWSNKKLYWKYEDGIIETSIENLNQENIQYQYANINIENLEKYSIYTMFDDISLRVDNEIYYQKMIYDSIGKFGIMPCYLIPILTVILLLIGVYLIYAIGHEDEQEEIHLNTFDKWSYEWVFIIWILLISMLIAIFAEIVSIANMITLMIALVIYILCYIITAVLGVTTIKRIKAKKFFRSFLIYKVLRWVKQKLIKVYELVVYNGNIGKTITILYLAFIIISLVLACFFWTGLGVILLFVFWGWCWYTILKYAKQLNQIKEALEKIYNGNTDIHLEEDELKGVLKQMVIYINDIAGGFSNAIEQSLKSERLKTELITNVSHDIKTPLTSIINYVDLLKKEEIKNEQVKEYLDILDQKSQRLKKLIEDLVEASKASSGNVTLNMEKMNVKELMKQTIGEFKDRFEKKNLEIELSLPDNELYILADNKYMYRVIENLYSNITKYALENSRVYLDVIKEKDKLKIQMKNISKEKLNISADELMQRFVRGDKSRTTEGSGLGISISKSLTELQNGRFNMTIDGDLFKVELEFDLI